MTAYTPSYKVLINSVEVTDVTVANVTITSGRTDIYSQPVAGYCQLQLLNFDNSIYSFTVGTQIIVEVTDSTAAYVPCEILGCPKRVTATNRDKCVLYGNARQRASTRRSAVNVPSACAT